MNDGRQLPSDFIDRLVTEWGYPRAGAELLGSRLTQADDAIFDAFRTWWDTGALQAPEIEGYTVERLMTRFHMNEIAALLTLQWLRKEPETAKAALARGFDRIGRRPGGTR